MHLKYDCPKCKTGMVFTGYESGPMTRLKRDGSPDTRFEVFYGVFKCLKCGYDDEDLSDKRVVFTDNDFQLVMLSGHAPESYFLTDLTDSLSFTVQKVDAFPWVAPTSIEMVCKIFQSCYLEHMEYFKRGDEFKKVLVDLMNEVSDLDVLATIFKESRPE